MKPSDRYDEDLAAGLITEDAAQRQVVRHFDTLYEAVQQYLARQNSRPRFLGYWLGRRGRESAPAGIYLWGGVGRGKTYLMDLFYESLPPGARMRTHFHRFMQDVHRELARLQGRKNPLADIASALAREARVICFDEFFVLDIGDAMLLAGLFDALFERGVILVATSNIPPHRLYEDGLQRERFLPAIALIEQHTRVLQLDSATDYRLRRLSQATLYHTPIDANTDSLLYACFIDLAPEKSAIREGQPIPVLEREIASRCCADDVAWFDFAALCDGPRSAFDYVELSRLFHAIIVASVPVLDAASEDQARRFVNLIDALYDRRVKLVISAHAPIESLYQGQLLAFEFERTRSRLIEMQSHDYLCRGHLA